ncbi:MAG: PstS family phosphate ABC transporter substrate-binding protein [Candidatus Woesearchaeota archaeon]
MKTNIFLILFLGILVLVTSGCSNVTGDVVYESKDTIIAESQNIEITGSDTLLQVVSSLAEAYKKENSDIKISVTGGGSGTGIASLINGDIDIADSSRKIKDSELKLAKDKGLEVIEVPIAQDTLSVIVHKNNPITKLTIEEISKIYSGEITNWKEIGGNDLQITLYGRQSTSGTYVYFMEEVVKADYSSNMRNMEGNQAIVDAVSQDKSSIGYVGVGYIADLEEKHQALFTTIMVAKDKNSEYITPLDETKIDTYPISRELFQYIAQKPKENSPIYKYLMFVLSDNGQDVVENSGFIRLNSDKRDDIIRKLKQ